MGWFQVPGVAQYIMDRLARAKMNWLTVLVRWGRIRYTSTQPIAVPTGRVRARLSLSS